MVSRPPTNPNNDAKGISELVDELRPILNKFGMTCINNKGEVDLDDVREETAHSILKALHKAVSKNLPRKETRIIGKGRGVDQVNDWTNGYNEALKEVRTTLNALLQPYKLRSRK